VAFSLAELINGIQPSAEELHRYLPGTNRIRPDGEEVLTTPALSNDHLEAVIAGNSEEEHEVGTYPKGNNTGLQDSGFRTADHNLSELMVDQFETMENLLFTLRLHAEAAAPRFCRAMLTGFLPYSAIINPSTQEMKLLTTELQQWFVDLFTIHNSGDFDHRDRRLGSTRSSNQLPVSFLLGNLEIILLAGFEVTSQSPQMELAFRAYVMKLACELTKYQIDVEQRLEFMSELMLLD